MNRPASSPHDHRRRRWLPWLLVLLGLAAVAVLGWRNVATRQAQREAQQSAPRTAVMELAPQDIARAQTHRFRAELPISGTLQAVHSTTVKARVAGDIRDFSVREGDTVDAGQLIARVEPTEYDARLRQAEQQAQASQAQARVAQRQYDNNRALVDEGFISKTALANSRADLDAALANARAAQAATEAARQTLRDTRLTAPITGQISQRLVAAGDYVAPGTPVVDIVDLSELELQVPLSPADSVQVRAGQQARLTVEGSAQPVTATVDRINPSTQAGSRSVLAYLRIGNPEGLRQGLFAQGVLTTREQEGLLVPATAIRNDQPKPYVQIVTASEAGQRIAYQPVSPGVHTTVDGQPMVVVTGLDEDTVVLRAAAGRLAEGTPVRVIDDAAGDPE